MDIKTIKNVLEIPVPHEICYFLKRTTLILVFIAFSNGNKWIKQKNGVFIRF